MAEATEDQGAGQGEAPASHVQIHVLKTFRFCYFRKPEDRLATERVFSVGVHDIEVGDPMLEHPWIRDHYADGRIERPEVRQAREQVAIEQAQRQRKDAEEQIAKAEAAFRRSVKQKSETAVDNAALDKELNTPVSDLRTRGQLAGTPGVKAAGADVHKTVAQLRQEQGSEPAAVVAKKAGKASGAMPRP